MDESILFVVINVCFAIAISYRIYKVCESSGEYSAPTYFIWGTLAFGILGFIILCIEEFSGFFDSVDEKTVTKTVAISLLIFWSFYFVYSFIVNSFYKLKKTQRKKKYKKEQMKTEQHYSEIENAFINFASKHNGIIMKKELTEIFGNNYSNKELLKTIDRLRDEGVVEIQGDSYVLI